MDDFGSLAHVKNTPIGDETRRGVSGGQRKRVNIGMEMVSIYVLTLYNCKIGLVSFGVVFGS